MSISRAFLVCLSVCLMATGTQAQQNEKEILGKGIHAFHAGNLEQAVTLFNRLEKQGSDDPRIFYFRGLCRTNLGNTDAAQADFKKGAKHELLRLNLTSIINDSLQRVQGESRLQLEKIRWEKIAPALEKKSIAVTISGTRTQVSLPFHSLKLPENGEVEQGNPNLPDSSQLNVPTLPFPNLKPVKKSTPKAESKSADDSSAEDPKLIPSKKKEDPFKIPGNQGKSGDSKK